MRADGQPAPAGLSCRFRSVPHVNKPLVLVLVVASVLSWPPTRATDSEHFLTPGEMVKAMEASKTHYKIDTLKSLKDMGPEQFADIYWPPSKSELEFPWISDDGKGGLSLTSYPFDAGANGCREAGRGGLQG